MVAPNHGQWRVAEADSFLFKAQQNLIFAEHARQGGRYDIEANRIYYALHQLACELLRKGLMTIDNPGRRTTPAQPWRVNHGSYDNAIRKVVKVVNIDRTISGLRQLRQLADYEPEQVCKTHQWKTRIHRLRNSATEVAEAIYEILTQ